MRTRLNTCNFDAHRFISIWFIAILIIWCGNPLNEVHIISHADNWYFSDSNWFFFQLKIHEMIIEIKIISFSIYAMNVSHVIAFSNSYSHWLIWWLSFLILTCDCDSDYNLCTINGHWISDRVIVYWFVWCLQFYSVTISCACTICVKIQWYDYCIMYLFIAGFWVLDTFQSHTFKELHSTHYTLGIFYQDI